MDEREVLKAIEGLGYQLLPKTHHDSPGGSGLVVAIRKEPTRKHFDPETVRLRLPDMQGMVKWRSLSLLSPDPGSDRVCAGHVILSDRIDKRVEFYTFGGSLQVISAKDAQVYALLRVPRSWSWSPKKTRSPISWLPKQSRCLAS